MTDLKNLCERLRADSESWCNSPPMNPDGPEAAEVIERLVEALREISAESVGSVCRKIARSALGKTSHES